jgi:hypothetical protein
VPRDVGDADLLQEQAKLMKTLTASIEKNV